MLYVTLLDQFHPGIYSSQVIDVCDYLNSKHRANIRLVAFLSVKELIRTDARKKLKQLSPSALVLPSFPGLRNFEWTALFLFFVCLFTGERIAICRNVFCARMALRVKSTGLLKKVVLDGRSALSAEIKEYDVFPVAYLRSHINRIEKYAVNNCDFRIAVSNKLVQYWHENHEYVPGNEVVIPCTLDNKYFSKETFSIDAKTEKIKNQLGIVPGDIVLVYSGSTAPWQSFKLLDEIMTPVLNNNSRIKILFLSRENKDNIRFREKFVGRVFIKWLEHDQVLSYLNCCDYGILLREQSDTNKVASPVKFAEYLYAGLKVLITENIGDFSSFVKEHHCGLVVARAGENLDLQPVGLDERKKCFELAVKNFKKDSFKVDQQYLTLVTHTHI